MRESTQLREGIWYTSLCFLTLCRGSSNRCVLCLYIMNCFSNVCNQYGQTKKSSSALSGAQNNEVYISQNARALEQNLTGAKMSWSEGAQNRTKHSNPSLEERGTCSCHPSHFFPSIQAMLGRMNGISCLWRQLLHDLFRILHCLDMHLIISFSCTIFWIRRFEVRLSERSRASPAPHRNFRIEHSNEPHVAPRVSAGSAFAKGPLTCRCFSWAACTSNTSMNIMSSENQNSEWSYEELCVLLSAAQPLTISRFAKVFLIWPWSLLMLKARVPPVTSQSLGLQLLQLLYLWLKLLQHQSGLPHLLQNQLVCIMCINDIHVYIYIYIYIVYLHRGKIEYDQVLSSAFGQMPSLAVSAFTFNRVTVAAGGLRANASFTSWTSRRLSRAKYVNS